MINLLPRNAQKRVVRLYRMRLFTATLFLVSFMLFSAVALLAPAYLIASSHESTVRAQRIALDQKIEEKQSGLASEAIRNLNKQLSIIEVFRQATSTYEVLGAIHAVKSSEIVLHSLSFERASLGQVVLLTGVAETREALKNFTEELKRLPQLSEVALPVSNFTEAKNNRFTISAKLSSSEVSPE